MTKTAEKPYPLGRTYLYSPYKEVLPSGGINLSRISLHLGKYRETLTS